MAVSRSSLTVSTGRTCVLLWTTSLKNMFPPELLTGFAAASQAGYPGEWFRQNWKAKSAKLYILPMQSELSTEPLPVTAQANGGKQQEHPVVFADGEDPAKRLEGLILRFEDWHAIKNLYLQDQLLRPSVHHPPEQDQLLRPWGLRI
ncbi:hypothetical protein Bbelb_351260 [Branchiostoma belcheri]|nr:hypothetical protein Bbelb_351260 [Branchiostoma belcheri]